MSKRQGWKISRGGSEISVLAGTIDIRPEAQTTATLELDPTSAVEISLDPEITWDLLVTDETDSSVAPTCLMRGAVAVSASYSGRYDEPTAGGGGGAVSTRTVVLRDRFAEFKEDGPAADVTRTDTDTHAELAWIAEQIGIPVALTNLDPVDIPSITYTRDSGYWGPLASYFAEFTVQIFVDPSSGALRVSDTSALDNRAPRAATPITVSKVNGFSGTANRVIVPVQFRVDYTEFAGDGGASPPLVVLRKENERREPQGDDDSTVVTWDLVCDLYENPDTPTVKTRTVEAGNGQTHIGSDHREIGEQITTLEYEADYTRIRRKTTAVKSRVVLPGVGETYREVQRTIETNRYEPHELLPGKYYLRQITKRVSGIYVYAYTGNLLEDLKTATPVVDASLAGSASPDGDSQRWASGAMRIRVDTFRRTSGSDLVIVNCFDRDVLRRRTRYPESQTRVADILVGSDGYRRFEYVPKTVSGGRRAQALDATLIGHDAGVRLAERRLARAGASARKVDFELLDPSYTEYRLGWVVPLGDDFPWGFEGSYLCTGASFAINPSTSGEPAVTETLSLAREW